MSTPTAIAAVTAVLRNLLQDGVIDDRVTNAIGNVQVSALAPDLIPTGAAAPSQLNLFLYQVTRNAGWANAGMPAHDADGRRLANPPLGLDLHYLMTSYASRDLHAEILLGYGMHLLHENPILTRPAIRRALGVPNLVSPVGSLPPDLLAVGASELAEQLESIKVVPHNLGTDELSKLWSAFQSHFRPSAGFQVSVVLIQATRPTRTPLPVRAVRVHIDSADDPVIDQLLHQDAPGGPIDGMPPVLARHRLVLRGRGLGGNLDVRIGRRSIPPIEATSTQLVVPIPAGVLAGVQTVQLLRTQLLGDPLLPHALGGSNLLAFVLHPEIVGAIQHPDAETVRLVVSPPVEPMQRVELLLDERATPASPDLASPRRAYSFAWRAPSVVSPQTATPLIEFETPGVGPGTYLVRVRVDGAASPLARGLDGAFDAPSVVFT